MISGLFSAWGGKRGRRRPRGGEVVLPGVILAMFARRRRKKGYYDLWTLALYRAAWRQRRSPSALLEYVLFRRDLGHRMPNRWAAPLMAGLGKLQIRERRLALAVLAEVPTECLAGVPVRFISEGAERMTPLACWSRRLGGETAPAWLARLDESQQDWRDSFAGMLRQKRTEGICVVGNSGSLRGGGHGGWIDGHGLVVRFNRFRSAESDVADIGAKVHVWVGAPGFSGGPPDEAEWTVITGPDMRYRRQNWEALRSRLEQARPVLTVPLDVWRALVALTCAPPSAGLLLLAWLKTLLGSWDGISSVGLGVAPSQETPYHHADSGQKPVGRHNWEAERSILWQWRAEGLRMK